MKMRKLVYMAAIAVTFGVLAGLPSAAQAVPIPASSYLGQVVSGEPSNPSDEEGYINNLISLAPGSLPTTIDGHLYVRSGNSCGTCPAAVFDHKNDNPINDGGVAHVDLGTGGFTYLLGKYDGPNGGDAVWNVQGLTGIVDIPFNMFGFDLSHWSLFGPGGGGVPDGGTTVMLLGAALGALGTVRRFLKI